MSEQDECSCQLCRTGIGDGYGHDDGPGSTERKYGLPDDWLERLESLRPGPFMSRYYAILRIPSNLRRKWREFREFFIRGRRGWAPSDTWNLDVYLALVMGESLARLAESSHGWPGEGSEWPTFEDWQSELRGHSRVLLAYSKSWDWKGLSETEECRREIEVSIARLATLWDHLWD